jgi:predicted transporter
MMLYKSLILGVLFGIGLFAVKSGIGLSYLVSLRRRPWGKALALLLFAVAYGLLFGLAALLLQHFDPVRHLEAIQTFLQSGMIVHLVMAGMMAIWGVVLLKRHHSHGAVSRGWLMLVMPCPVCAAVILFSAAFFASLFPDSRWGVIWGLYLAFMLISLLAMGIVHLLRHRMVQPSESFLGGAMLLMAVYFILSVTIMPQFADLDSVYRLARYQTDNAPRNIFGGVLLAIIAAAAFGTGCLFNFKHIRSST